MGGGRGGERQYRWTSKPLGDAAEGEVVGTEIVAPLADAVRLIDNEEADRAGEEVLEERAILESLRREVQDLALTPGDLPVYFATLGSREVRMHRHGADALRGELVVLVFHQGDERTHHDRKARQENSRKLIDERLSAPRRHYDQRVLAGQHGVERVPLAAPEILVAKSLGEQLAGCLLRYLLRHPARNRHKAFPSPVARSL